MNNNNYDAFRTFIEGRVDFGGGGRAGREKDRRRLLLTT